MEWKKLKMKTLKTKVIEYWSAMCTKLEITKVVTWSTKIIDVHDQIKCLKNEKLKLSDKVLKIIV